MEFSKGGLLQFIKIIRATPLKNRWGLPDIVVDQLLSPCLGQWLAAAELSEHFRQVPEGILL